MNQQERQISVIPARGPARRPLGAVLQEQGKINSEDESRVLLHARERGILFGEAARALGLVSASDVQQALARQFDYRYLQPGEGDYSPELYAAYDPFGREAESLRHLRSQLMERWFNQGHKTLAISALCNDAPCSMLAANLAVSFSQLNLRTLLVDANLRRPRQHEIFRCETGRGLTDILAGRLDAEALFPLAHFQDLHVLAAGTLPPNPHEMLGRPYCRHVFETISERFDVILFDTPAFTAANEAFSIAAMAGGVLLLCERDRSTMADLAAVSARLMTNGASIVGSVCYL